MNNISMDIPVKPRVLIADDSRIVRATLIKHIEGMFEFREALDGEQAWETLLIDPSIRVVITDLTMPKLDGYGLLQRIRASKIPRIRNIPVVVVSGSDEQAESERAKAAGATDLISKGIGTAQLLSRLDVLSKLTNTQSEFERGLEILVQNAPEDVAPQLASADVFDTKAEELLVNAIKLGKNFVILNVCVGLQSEKGGGTPSVPPLGVVNAVGQLLNATVRQTDCVAQTGEAEFTLATGHIQFDGARNFAQRVCGAIAQANLVDDPNAHFIATCGMISLSEYAIDPTCDTLSLNVLREIVRDRAMLGVKHGVSGVVGAEEEEELRMKADAVPPDPEPVVEEECEAPPDLATLLQWLKEGKRDQALLHIGKFSEELQPLMSLLNLDAK
jgi:two-component system cell cycle response regulator